MIDSLFGSLFGGYGVSPSNMQAAIAAQLHDALVHDMGFARINVKEIPAGIEWIRTGGAEHGRSYRVVIRREPESVVDYSAIGMEAMYRCTSKR